jgi:hypothetical protein
MRVIAVYGIGNQLQTPTEAQKNAVAARYVEHLLRRAFPVCAICVRPSDRASSSAPRSNNAGG